MKACSLPITNWKIPENNKEIQDLLVKELSLEPIISQILSNRNITTPEGANKYLCPSLKDLHNPFSMKDMKKGVDRLIKAIFDREKVVIYGDYDADGITSVVTLLKFLEDIGHNSSYYIPDRISEGYGLNISAINKFKAEGIALIITVDCGISDHEQIAYAKSIGIDTIVLDHHEVPNTIPNAVAVINQNQKDCKFPFKYLAAVGIVFNFLIALRASLREKGFWTTRKYPNLKEYLDLVALGTVGDISPLIDENRIFVKIGLDLINEDKRPGLKALKEISGIDNQVIDAMRSSFYIIPRINAAGRVASAGEAVKLLMSEDSNETKAIAMQLEMYNRKRQSLEKTILQEIIDEIENRIDLTNVYSLVFASPKWHPGVVGIVASRLVDKYCRPAILISLNNGIGKGSGRSVADFNIYKGLQSCDSLLLSYGGHRYAAGISIREEDISAFQTLLEKTIKENHEATDFISQTVIDAQCRLSEINHRLISQMNMLAPFGCMNPEPVLCIKNISVISQSIVGNNHLWLRLSGDGVSLNSIWYAKGHLIRSITGSTVDVAFTPQINHWNGSSDIQLKLKDILLSSH